MPLPESSTAASAGISIELAEKMLTKFNGQKNKLYEFIDNADKADKLIKAEFKEILFHLIETKLTDNAREVTRTRDFSNWADLKKHLLDVYSEKRTMAQWQLELNSCKQNSQESILSYSNKVETCYIKLIQSLDPTLSPDSKKACIDLLKNEALNVFLTGLNRDIALIVKSRKPNTLEDAIHLALSEEQEQKSRFEIFKYQNVNTSSARFCQNCSKPGHTTISCRFNQNNSSQQSHNKNFKVEQNVRHINRSNSNYSSKLNPVNKSNPQNQNFSQNSDYNSKTCNYCKKKGHIISECRKREYNNNKKRQLNSDNSQNLNAQGSQQAASSRLAHTITAEYQQ